jgi:hypothetical protein
MVVRYVNSPKITEQSARTIEMAILAFLLPVVGAVGIALALENLQTGGRSHDEQPAHLDASSAPQNDVLDS